MTDFVIISAGQAAVIGLLGYGAVFLGLIALMVVVMILGKAMITSAKKPAFQAESEPAKATPAPGSAGELKLYDTDPKDAAMIMAIVADTLGKPLNELRFKSIREVKE